MPRTTATLHGLRISWSCAPHAYDAASALFEHLPPGESRSDLHLAFTQHTTQLSPTTTFYHGRIRGTVIAGDVLLWDDISSLRVHADGKRIDIAASPVTDEDRHILTHVTLFIALVCALRHRHWFHMHAGALGGQNGGVLVLGDSGSGKSTSTLSLAQAGYDLLTDDATFLLPDGHVVGFPKGLHLTPRTLQAFPSLAPHVGHDERDPDGKFSLTPDKTPYSFTGDMTPRTLLFPCIGVGPTRAERLAPAEALDRLIAASALLVVPDMPESSAHFLALSALTNSTHGAVLHLGPDALANPALIAAAALSVDAPPPQPGRTP